MIYAKVDVELRDHTKAHLAGAAMATWTWALLYARGQQTDGIIPSVALRGAWVGEKDARKHAAKLVEVGLWEVHEGGWRICRYAEKNDTRAVIDQNRERSRERMQRVRANNQRTSVEPPTIEQPAVPGSGSGSGSGSPPDSREQPSGPPDWFHSACDTVEVALPGETIDRAASWLRYDGHRSSSGSKSMSSKDAQYWLTTVDVAEARKQRKQDAERREREAKWDRRRGGPGSMNDTTPPPTPEQEAKAMEAFHAARAKFKPKVVA